MIVRPVIELKPRGGSNVQQPVLRAGSHYNDGSYRPF